MVKIIPKARSGTSAFVTRREQDLFDRFGEMEYLDSKFDEYIRRYKYPKNQKNLIRKALDFARLAHKGQLRDEGSPYITHPIRVASILLHELATMECDWICAALLHDVIEDCQITVKELKNNFNETIAEMVRLLSKDPSLQNHKKVYFEGILHARDSVQLIKLCDRLDNLRSLRFATNKTKTRRYLTDTEKYVTLASQVNNYLLKEMKQEVTLLKNRLR